MEGGFAAKLFSNLCAPESSATTFDSSAELGSGRYGCSHYRRRCKIRSPCCNKIFGCRHCHNEAMNSLEINPLDRHDIPRHEVKTVICCLCGTEQDVQSHCMNCGVCLGKYFCAKCKLYDDDVSKKQFHCDECGICRIGGRENFFHCKKCCCCYINQMKDKHPCIERAMHQNCPVCFEFLFDTMKDTTILHCGHTIHLECLKEMLQHFRYTCPVCFKSISDMSIAWRQIDEEIKSTPTPSIYQNKMVRILCNDCGANSQVNFHCIALKCQTCKSYNTRQIKGGSIASCSQREPEMVR